VWPRQVCETKHALRAEANLCGMGNYSGVILQFLFLNNKTRANKQRHGHSSVNDIPKMRTQLSLSAI
jgi:hypothetical protein